MSKLSPDRKALIARVKVAAKALDIPQEAVDHVVKHGTSYHRGKALDVLFAFAGEFGVSLDYLISGDLSATFRSAAILLKVRRSKAA